jgi:hypothetical protein
MKIAAVLAPLLLLPLSVHPAQHSAPQSSSPSAIAATLRTGTIRKQLILARQLGIQGADRHLGLKYCQIHIDHPTLELHNRTAVLRVLCYQDLTLILFAQKPGLHWRRLDSFFAYDPYTTATVSYKSLIHPPVQQVIVQNDATVSGNVYEAYFLVLRVVSGKFRTALTVLQTGIEPHFGGQPRAEKSTFSLQPATAGEPGEIDQTAKITIGKLSRTVRSSYSWYPDLKAFAQDGIPFIPR